MRLIDADRLMQGLYVIRDRETGIPRSLADWFLSMVDETPTIQPQGIDKKEVIEKMTDIIVRKSCNLRGCEQCNYAYEYGTLEESCEDYVGFRKTAETFYEAFAINIFNQQPTTDVPDTNVGEIPQLYKDRVEHVIKVLESCKQRHIDIVTDLPHTVEIERGTISAYSMALKVVRECLLQPYKESE